jgi:AcrR family transcriptional regulator
MSPRSYDNTGRAEQARATRRRILEAARDLIVERGPAAITMRDIAERARVSPETLYKTFGTKSALVKDVYDVTLAGDDEDVSMSDRPGHQAIRAATDVREKLALYAALARAVSERVGPLLSKLQAAAQSGDPDMRDIVATTDAERLAGATYFVETGWLRPGLELTRARDIVWTLNSPQLYQMLVGERGWSPQEYERWLAKALGDALT